MDDIDDFVAKLGQLRGTWTVDTLDDKIQIYQQLFSCALMLSGITFEPNNVASIKWTMDVVHNT